MTPWVLRLLLVNGLMFVASSVDPGLQQAFSFVPVYALERPWTILTYMFLHADFGHIFFNMLALFFFGPRLEAELGGSRFLGLYFVSGVTAGLVSLVMSPMVGIVGASGAIFGVMLGFAYLWPREHVYFWMIPIEARWMVVVMTVIALAGGLGFGGAGVAHFAHLGGFLGGYVFLKLIGARSAHIREIAEPPPPPVRSVDRTRWAGIDRDQLHPVNREEFDRIWAKLGSSGLESLTSSEIAFLDRFSAR